MKMKSIALAVIATASFAAPADAAVYLISYQGVILSGNDATNAFGVGIGSLAGLSYQADYLFDDSIPGLSYSSNGSSIVTVSGGSIRGNTSPFLTATLTINGVSTIFSSLQEGLLEQRNNHFGVDSVRHQASYFFDNSSQNFSSFLYNQFQGTSNIVDSINLTDNLFYTQQPGVNSNGTAAILSIDKTTNTIMINAQANLRPTSVRISAVSAVPEPASWAMFISGFGMIGGGMRYRKRRSTISFA
mgnify:CR=1 FL=1